MFKKFIDKGKDLAQKTELTSRLESAFEATKQGVAEQFEASKIRAADLVDGKREKMEEAISKLWPNLESELVRKLVDAAEGTLSDVGLVEEIFTKSYELLPAPVRLIVSRKYYIDYCMSHREPLLEKVRGFKAENYSESVAKGQLIAGLTPLPDGAQESSVPAGSETDSKGPVMAPLTKVCPMCAEDIKIAAIVCRYCGHKFRA